MHSRMIRTFPTAPVAQRVTFPRDDIFTCRTFLIHECRYSTTNVAAFGSVACDDQFLGAYAGYPFLVSGMAKAGWGSQSIVDRLCTCDCVVCFAHDPPTSKVTNRR